jgi:hypothetical protein
MRLTPAGGNHGCVPMLAEKLLQIRQSIGGLGKQIQAQLNEFKVFRYRLRAIE